MTVMVQSTYESKVALAQAVEYSADYQMARIAA